MKVDHSKFRIGFIYPGYENLGIEYLSACLKQRGFSTRLFFDPVLFDESGFLNNRLLKRVFSSRERILREIDDYSPDIVCFSVISDNYNWACGWAQEIKKRKSVPVIFGGIHPSSVPEKSINNPFVDYVCVGEGDKAIIDLAEALAYGKSGCDIKNIWAKQDEKIIKNDLRPLITNLDEIPFADKDLFYARTPIFNSGYIISTSRGCPYTCSYCCNSVWKNLYAGEKRIVRRRSPENVIRELKIAKSTYNPRYINFWDEVFNSDHSWLGDFLPRYAKEIKLPFFCFIYPDLSTEKIVRLLKNSGCYKVQLGVQITDEHKRKHILGRQSSNEAIKMAVSLFKKENIYVVCDAIFGVPGESDEGLEKTAYFYDECLPDHIEIFWLRYYPKTNILEWAFDNGFVSKEEIEDIEEGKVSGGIVVGSRHSKSLTKKFVLLFYLFHFLPRWLRQLVLQKKLYRFLPSSFPPISLYIVSRILKRAKYDVNISRTIRRYMYYMLRL